MGKLISYLFLRLLLKMKLLKVESLTSKSISSFWANFFFTESELEILSNGMVIDGEKTISVSVIIIHHEPTRLAYLVECIKSINAQIYDNFEVVIVTNYQFSLNELRIFESLEVARILLFNNSHPSDARNFGMKSCKSQLIAFVDDDNLLLPWHLLFLVNSYNLDPATDIFAGSFLSFENNFVTQFPLRYLLSRETLLLGDPTDSSSVAVNRSCFPEICWDAQVLSENWAFFVDAFEKGAKIHQIAAPLSLHRSHLESRTMLLERPLIPSEWFKKYRNHVDWGMEIPDSIRKARYLKIIHAFSTTFLP